MVIKTKAQAVTTEEAETCKICAALVLKITCETPRESICLISLRGKFAEP